MMDLIRRLLAGDAPADAAPAADAAAPAPDAAERRLRVATCALLLEMAHADAEFSAAERARIEAILSERFGLGPSAAHALMEEAEARRRDAVDLHGFTSVLTSHYDEQGRFEVARQLWRVVDADGDLSRHEDYLLRRLAALLDLRPGLLAEARRAARDGAR
uniref:TerB family tellurite resistance protein n=1 Tax=Eiseniibacteriota bacterium TaxID=2212470 RepID=A0A832I691_UNCEI